MEGGAATRGEGQRWQIITNVSKSVDEGGYTRRVRSITVISSEMLFCLAIISYYRPICRLRCHITQSHIIASSDDYSVSNASSPSNRLRWRIVCWTRKIVIRGKKTCVTVDSHPRGTKSYLEKKKLNFLLRKLQRSLSRSNMPTKSVVELNPSSVNLDLSWPSQNSFGHNKFVHLFNNNKIIWTN